MFRSVRAGIAKKQGVFIGFPESAPFLLRVLQSFRPGIIKEHLIFIPGIAKKQGVFIGFPESAPFFYMF